LVGKTRAARLATAGTLIAIAIAIVAFLSLDTDDGIPRDDYTLSAEALCLEAKEEIAAAATGTAAASGTPAPGAYASEIVPIAANWREAVDGLQAPPDRSEPASELSAALLKVVIEAGALARHPASASEEELLAQAARVDAASGEVEAAIDALGLSECGEIAIGPRSPSGQ
jgi:hypothetical protein